MSTQASAGGILLPWLVGLRIQKERLRKRAQAPFLPMLSTPEHVEGTPQPATGRDALFVSTNLGFLPSNVLSINRMGRSTGSRTEPEGYSTVLANQWSPSRDLGAGGEGTHKKYCEKLEWRKE